MTVVAIDGPAGSGKSTIAGALARRLGVVHVDTGAYYRAAAYLVLRSGVALEDVGAVSDVVRGAVITRRGGRTLVDGVDVEDEIRGPTVTKAVSSVAAMPEIRRHLVALQQAAIPSEGAVVEGRDAGTVVVADADLKVWLTATPAERARRRAGQLGTADPAAVQAHTVELERRDRLDARQMARAADATEIDTTDRSVEEIVDDICSRILTASPPS